MNNKDRQRDALEWIAEQVCDHTSDADVRACPASGGGIAEWCLPCYARAALEKP